MARQRAPGWYSDPDAPGHWRWWDGQAWTEHAVSAFPVEVRSGPEPEDALPRGPRAGEPEPTRVVPLLPPSPGTLPSPAATPSPSGGPAGAGDAGSDATVTAP
ncbi:MAG TPA: DUF2510 domain-containing protein, partial [Acidimicrobiales bacterium]|nr:DUF2510 domain-containing protein [Acidimicrobiales bacterium]